MKAFVIVPLCGALFLCSGCVSDSGPPVPPATNIKELVADQPFQQLVRREVAVRLKDPESARFGPMRVPSRNWNGRDELVVCGWVNAKNSYGGYNGQTPYIGKFHDRTKQFELVVMGDESPNAGMMVLSSCRAAGISIG